MDGPLKNWLKLRNKPWSECVADLESDEGRDDDALDEGGRDEVEEDGKDGKLINGFQNPFTNLTSAQIISPAALPLQQSPQQNLNTQNNIQSQNQLITNSKKKILIYYQI